MDKTMKIWTGVSTKYVFKKHIKKVEDRAQGALKF